VDLFREHGDPARAPCRTDWCSITIAAGIIVAGTRAVLQGRLMRSRLHAPHVRRCAAKPASSGAENTAATKLIASPRMPAIDFTVIGGMGDTVEGLADVAGSTLHSGVPWRANSPVGHSFTWRWRFCDRPAQRDPPVSERSDGGV
jgi:hypothetical protein